MIITVGSTGASVLLEAESLHLELKQEAERETGSYMDF